MRRGSNSDDRTGPNEELIPRENNALCDESKVTEDVPSSQRCPPEDDTNASEVKETCGEDELRDETLSCEAGLSNDSEIIQTSESKECTSTVQSKKQFIHLPLDKQKSSETHHLQASTEENTDCAILGNLIASKNEKCVAADTLDIKHCLISPSLGWNPKSVVTEGEAAHYSSLSRSPTVAGTTVNSSPCMLLNDPENRLRSAGSKNGGSSTAPRGVEPEHRLIMRTSSVEILRRVKPENSSAKSRVFVIQPSFKQVVNPVSDQSKTEDILVLISEKSAPNQDLSENSCEENQQDNSGRNVSPEVKYASTSRSKRNVLQQNRSAETQCNLSLGHERSSSCREDVDGCDEWSQEGSIELNESSNYSESLWVDGALQTPNRRDSSQKDLNTRCVKIQCNLPQCCSSSKPTRQFQARSKSHSPTKSTPEHDLSNSRFFKAFPASSDTSKSQMIENLSNVSKRESIASSTQIMIEEKILVRSTNKMNEKMTGKYDKCTLSTNILSNIRDLLIGTFSDSSSMHEDSFERPLVDPILSPTVPCPDQKVGDDSIPQNSKIQSQLFKLEEQPSMVASECECSLQSDRDHCHGLGLSVKQSAPPTTISDRSKNSSSPKKSRSMFDVNVNQDSIFKIRMSDCKSNESHVSEDAAVCLDDRWIGSYKDDSDTQTHENTISQKSRSAISSRSLPELNRNKDRGYTAERTQSQTLECREKGSTRPQGSNEIDVNFAPVFLQEVDSRRKRCPSISSEDVSGQAFCLYTLSAVDMCVGRRSPSVGANHQKENNTSGKGFRLRMKEGSCSGSEVGSEFCFENDPGALTGESSHFDPHPCREHSTNFRSESCSCSPWRKTASNLCIHNSSHTQPCSKKSSCLGCGQESNSCSDNRFHLRFINESYAPSEIDSHPCFDNHLEDESYPCREGCSCVQNQDDRQPSTLPCSEDDTPLRSRSGKEDLSHSCFELCSDKQESLPESNGPSECNPAERTECYPSSKQIDVEIGLMSTEVVCYGHPDPYTSCNSIATSTFVFTMAIASIVTFFVGMLFWRLHSER